METITKMERPSRPPLGLSALQPGGPTAPTAFRPGHEAWLSHQHRVLSVAVCPRPIVAAHLAATAAMSAVRPIATIAPAGKPRYAAATFRAQGLGVIDKASAIDLAPESVDVSTIGGDQQGTGVSRLAQAMRQGNARGVPPRGRPDS